MLLLQEFDKLLLIVPTSQYVLPLTEDEPRKRKYNVEESVLLNFKVCHGYTGWGPLKGNRKHSSVHIQFKLKEKNNNNMHAVRSSHDYSLVKAALLLVWLFSLSVGGKDEQKGQTKSP